MHRDRPAAAARERERLLDAVAEQRAVGQAGERVVQRVALVVDRACGPSACRAMSGSASSGSASSEKSAAMTTTGPRPSRMPTVEVCSSRSVRR